MGAGKQLKVALQISGTTLSYLTYQVIANPSVSRRFIRVIANTIADFQDTPDGELPVIKLHELCPGIESLELPLTVSFPEGYELPTNEYVCLAGLIGYLKPGKVFEIGTYKGRTTRLIAELTPERCQIYTLDLPPRLMVSGAYFSEERPELIGEEFRNHPLRTKIIQLHGDSRSFDFRPFYGQMNFIFVDGDHSYEVVKRDTAQALRMVKSGGVIVWDDYFPGSTPGVVRCVNELAGTKPIHRISGTRFAYYRAKEMA